jgi:hypothetical protein
MWWLALSSPFLQLVLFAVMGIPLSLSQNLGLTLAFTALSLARSYVLRRLFSRLHERHPYLFPPSAGAQR